MDFSLKDSTMEPMGIHALESLLLFLLSIALVMQFRILPVEGTPYWLFGVLFAILTTNVVFSLYPPRGWKTALLSRVRLWLLVGAVGIALGATTITAIVDRHKTAPIYGVHDIILQQEAAMRFILEGKNPYKETYFNTPMEDWHYAELGRDAINPALYHFVMPPWYLIFPFFFYAFSLPILGYFDGRFVLLACMIGTIIILLRWFKNKDIGRLAATLIALSPAIAPYFIEGRSDAFALFWLLWALYLLDRASYVWSAIIMGLALMSKQTIWFAAPFYALYMWVRVGKSIPKTSGYLLWTAVVVLGIAGPFLLWDAQAFIASVILYLSGGTETGYPVSGYGLGMVLYQAGVISDIHAYYPFVLWQLGLGVPTLILASRFLLADTRMSRLFMAYALSLLVIWYVSRYFNNSHISYIGSLFILGILKHWDEASYEQK
jgi:hypothetical protein